MIAAKLLSRFRGELPAPTAAPDLLVVEPVRDSRSRDAFITLPFELYRGDPNWVPDIVAERRDFLNPERNPFLRNAEVQLFVARRGEKVVGRIAAVNNPQYNQFHNTEVGFFGMFECIDDASVASSLFDAAASWVRHKGMKSLLGPANFSTNRECGLLVEGFDMPPAMFMTYNPPYYAGLLEAAGFRKAKDLWSYELSASVAPPEKVVRIAESLKQSPQLRVRPLNLADLPEETRRIKSIYDAMLDRIWGFVPMTDEEFEDIAARLRPLVQVRPELCLIAELKDEPVAFSLTFPDSNLAVRAAGGYLTRFGLPVGLFKMAWAARRIDRLRVLLFGIKPGYRRRGIDALLALETLHAARRLGYEGGELGWTTEDNELMNRAIESMGARRFKTWRMFERAV